VVVTPELLADHEVSGAALAEWTKYAVPTPEVVVVRWAQPAILLTRFRT
jgi:hypothetical protein